VDDAGRESDRHLLGENTASSAKGMDQFNPDITWKPAKSS
jgi:hypothetical protein